MELFELTEIGTGAVLATYSGIVEAMTAIDALPDSAKRNAFLRSKPTGECPTCKAPRAAAA